MFLLSLLTNKDSYNTQITQCVNDTIFRKPFRVPGFGTGSGTLEPISWNRFLRQITTCNYYLLPVSVLEYPQTYKYLSICRTSYSSSIISCSHR